MIELIGGIKMILRLCLNNKSSILIDGELNDINYQATNSQFIRVVNHNTQKEELYNRDNVWCVRISSQN